MLARSESPDKEDAGVQLALFKTPGEVVTDALKKLNISEMTPLEALNELNALKERLEKK